MKFIAYALLAGLLTPCYKQPTTLETVEYVKSHMTVCDDQYYLDADYDGDGNVTIVDAILAKQRVDAVQEFGNTVVIDSDVCKSIVDEVSEDQVIYWEIDFIGDEVTRTYEFSASEETRFHIYYETEEWCRGVYCVVNPISEEIIVDKEVW